MPQDWKPPRYTEEVNNEDDWQPPSYATSIEEDKPEEEHKPGIFSKIKSALTPTEKIHPGEGPKAKLDKFLGEVLSKPGIANRVLSSSDPGEESVLPTVKEAGIKEPTTFSGGFLKGLYDEFVRPLSSAVGAAGILGMGKGSPFHGDVPSSAKELSVRQPSREIPYKVAGDVPSLIEDSAVKQPSSELRASNLRPEDILPEELDKFNEARTQKAKEALKGEEPRYSAEDLAKADVEAKRLLETNATGKREKPSFVNPFKKKVSVEEWKPPEYAEAISEEIPKSSVEEVKPKAVYIGEQEGVGPLFNIEGGPKNRSTLSLNGLKEAGIEVPEYEKSNLSGTQLREKALAEKAASEGKIPLYRWQSEKGSGVPDWVKDQPEYQASDKASGGWFTNDIKDIDFYKKDSGGKGKLITKYITPEEFESSKVSNHPTASKFSVSPETEHFIESETKGWTPPSYAEEAKPGIILNDASKMSKESLSELNTFMDSVKANEPLDVNAEMNKVPESSIKSPDNIVEMSGGLGGINPSTRELKPSSGPYAQALDKLFSSLGKTSENRVQQDIINKTERARRFAESAGVTDVGVKGAAQSLSKLKGEIPKVDVDKLQMTQPQVDSLFTAVKRAKISEGEKARGYTALFKLMNGEGVPQRNELRILDDVFGNDFASKVTEMHGGLGAVGMKISKVANTMKAMMSSVDLSFPLKQGIGMIHTPEWRNAAVEQLKYFAKPEYYDAAMQAIEDRPKFMLGRESGLFLAKHGSLTQGEEAFAHNYLGSLPSTLRMPFDASERAYTGGLNKLRADLFDRLTDLAEKAGNEVFAENEGIKVPTKVAENIANYINVFTGRGKLGRLEPIANELNTVFWSPRLLSSRLTALNPKFYYDLDPFTRKEAIKSLFAVASASSTINALGAAAGAKVGLNILSSDFAKSRFSPSNNVLDPSGGFQQPIVAAARMIEEINRMKNGEKQQYGKPGIPGIAGNLLVNKLSPLAGLAFDIASAKKFTGKGNEGFIGGRGEYIDRFGKDKRILDETGKRFVPMFIQDVYDIVNSDPGFAETVGLLPLTALGAGEQNYPEKQDKKKFLFKKPSMNRLR